MLQAKFSLTESLHEFVANHQRYGFKDRSSMVREALRRLQEEIELQSLRQSADLYAELYADDSELQELTAAGTADWPE